LAYVTLVDGSDGEYPVVPCGTGDRLATVRLR